MKSFLKFLKYNAGVLVTAIFMACMAYKEFQHPRFGRENVPKIYLAFSIVLVILMVLIYFKYFHGKGGGTKRTLQKKVHRSSSGTRSA